MTEEKKPRGRPRKYTKGNHPNTLKATEPYRFKKGHVQNPKGREIKNPKKPSMDSIVNKIGNEKIRIQVDGVKYTITKFEKLVRNLFKDAIEGKPTAQKELVERVWGKSPTSLDVNITERKEYKGKDAKKYVEEALAKDYAKA